MAVALPKESRREAFRRELEELLAPDRVLFRPMDLEPYRYDAYFIEGTPDYVVFPLNTEEVVACVKAARRQGIPIIPRGAGTCLSGGPVAVRGGLVLCTAKMTRILEIDEENRCARVEPGVINLELQAELLPHGLHYAPDPASQQSSTIGGNVAENAGGPHCLAYGTTTNHVMGLEVVLSDGRVVELGGKAAEAPGYDLAGVVTGSEGTMGIVTKVLVKLTPNPRAVHTLLVGFPGVEEAGRAVSEIIGAGIIPVALEMMDKPVVRFVEEFVHAGYPTDAGAVLIAEVDGFPQALEDAVPRIVEICRANKALMVETANEEEHRETLWKGRKNAFGVLARIKPQYYLQDVVVPRTRIPEIMHFIGELAQKHDLHIVTVFHAGDGNLHPVLLYDKRDQAEFQRARTAGSELVEYTARLGGMLSGEHGIGIEKARYMPIFFDEASLQAMRDVKSAFDPDGICNPGKAVPEPEAGDQAH